MRSKVIKSPACNKSIIITGDACKDRFIYIEETSDCLPHLHEAWIKANRFWDFTLDGGAACLAHCFDDGGIITVKSLHGNNDAESIYILTRQKTEDDKHEKWRIQNAIVAGEDNFSVAKLDRKEFDGTDCPVIIIDYNQGWLNANEGLLSEILGNSRYIIRTHDPRRQEWMTLRDKRTAERGIWFSPVQDIADGSIWVPSNWEHVRNRIVEYLCADRTLWNGSTWEHFVVVQISFDGVLVLGPGLEKEGQLLIFKGDQPGSFLRKNYRTVLSGGLIFVHALADAILDSRALNKDRISECAKVGLSRLRLAVKEGYDGPLKKNKAKNWSPPQKRNLPIEKIKRARIKDLIPYSLPPEDNWDTACEIIKRNDKDLREKTVFTLGKLVTASPEYADSLIRLVNRVDSHVTKGEKILSFAIFGDPGSGKSFVAEQIALAVDPSEKKFERKRINLSQFTDPNQLVSTFKEIQTTCFKSKIPFVIWDEFDAYYKDKQAGWLPNFLMPMQDASFFDGVTKLSLDKCVFIFIGGTFPNENEFCAWTNDNAEIKGPDFHSRLDSSLTIPSITLDLEEAELFSGKDPAKLVRAILIRAFLKDKPKIKSISSEVLGYLLHVPLKHGVRSLQRIITASDLERTTSFQRCHLPLYDVLQLHIDISKVKNAHSVETFLTGINFPQALQDKLLFLDRSDKMSIIGTKSFHLSAV